MIKYFKGSIFSLIIGLALAANVGYYYGHSPQAALQAIFITFVLVVLEVSLSFDNAIVNAIVLKQMNQLWRHRFLTWGMIIAVFGMRLVFPLLIVSVIAQINPLSALSMAAFEPDRYAELMLSAHLPVAAFGGSFLMMVALKYFYDENKDEHWIKIIEEPIAKLGRLEAIEIVVTLLCLIFVSSQVAATEQISFLKSGIWGLITFVCVDGIGAWLEASEDQMKDIHKASAGMFIYLEVLDASFSFDGVVGAFAITHNLFIIMIGLGVGAFFVRSLTILFVEKETLSKFIFLEHGAFYAIGALAVIMLLDPIMHIPEWVSGLGGGVIIVTAFLASLRVSPSELSNKTLKE